jgi:HSP20 family molecular chaperone IbpA
MLNQTPNTRPQELPEIFAVPHVDIYEDEEGITLLADMPGVSKERLIARVDGDSLIVEGAIEPFATVGEMEMLYGETRASNYRRQFTLSRELDTSRIAAQLRDGLLRVSIPKAEAARPRRIEISAG